MDAWHCCLLRTRPGEKGSNSCPSKLISEKCDSLGTKHICCSWVVLISELRCKNIGTFWNETSWGHYLLPLRDINQQRICMAFTLLAATKINTFVLLVQLRVLKHFSSRPCTPLMCSSFRQSRCLSDHRASVQCSERSRKMGFKQFLLQNADSE